MLMFLLRNNKMNQILFSLKFAFWWWGRCLLSSPKFHKSEGSLLLRLTCPKVHHCSDSPVRRFFSQKVHQSEGPLVWSFTGPKVHQSEVSLVQRFTSPKVHLSEGSSVWRFNSLKVHQSEGSLIQRFISPKFHRDGDGVCQVVRRLTNPKVLWS